MDALFCTRPATAAVRRGPHFAMSVVLHFDTPNLSSDRPDLLREM